MPPEIAAGLKPCSRCHQNPCVSGQHWCRTCRTAHQRGRRVVKKIETREKTRKRKSSAKAIPRPFHTPIPHPEPVEASSLPHPPPPEPGCTVCARPDRQKVELAVLENGGQIKPTATRFAVPIKHLRAHMKKHLPQAYLVALLPLPGEQPEPSPSNAKVVPANPPATPTPPRTVCIPEIVPSLGMSPEPKTKLFKVRAISMEAFEEIKSFLNEVRELNPTLYANAFKSKLASIDQLIKLEELETPPAPSSVTVNILESPDFLTSRSVLAAILSKHPDARSEIVDALAGDGSPNPIRRALLSGLDPTRFPEGPAVPLVLDWFKPLRWIDGTPLLDHIENYRRAIFTGALDTRDETGRPRFNLILTGRAKKNWKTADLVFAALFKLLAFDSPGGNQCYLLANDEEQAGDDLELAIKIVRANPPLSDSCTILRKEIVRKDGKGSLLILPAGDVAGAHGKTYLFAGFDEIHGYKTWDILEAMQLDPSRPDATVWITSYASIYHRPGVPLFDLCAKGWAGQDPRMFFSWYAGDKTTDQDFKDADPESRANPSRVSWADPDYLDQQRRRLPAHKFRRLHLNLPGLPEGSAFQVEPVSQAMDRSYTERPPEPGRAYHAFVDMSGGSSDDAVLAIGYRDPDKRAIVVRVLNQGQPPPFDPRMAVDRFAAILSEYEIYSVTGDEYGGQTFRMDFERHGITYRVAALSASKLYEALAPTLNGGRVVLPNIPELEQQLLGLVWRGGRIDHPSGEHDDYSNAAAGLIHKLCDPNAIDFDPDRFKPIRADLSPEDLAMCARLNKGRLPQGDDNV